MPEPIPPKGKIILDSNLWLFACASAGSEGPDNNSKFDRNTRANNIDSKKYRGAIIQAFKGNYTILPEKVVEELYGKSQHPDMSPKNRANIEAILREMFGRETPTEISRADLEEQNSIFKEIEARAATAAQNPNPLNNACARTWKKIKDHAIDAEVALQACPQKGIPPYNILLAELGELRRRKKELTRTPAEAQAYFKEITTLEAKTRRTKPFLLPDIEILVCAEKTRATVITKDMDMAVLWACSPERFQKQTKKPVVLGQIGGPETEFRGFLKEANKSVRKHPPEEHEPEV